MLELENKMSTSNEKTRGGIAEESSEGTGKRLTTEKFFDIVMHQPNTRSSNTPKPHNSKRPAQTRKV